MEKPNQHPALSDYAGIDYTLLNSSTNRNQETGIHYGLISLHSLSEYAIEDFEPDYGEPSCPKCGNSAVDAELDGSHDTYEYAQYECADYACEDCQYVFGGESAYSEEPIAWTYESTDYTLQLDNDNNVWVFNSSYYTYAQYCSPCMPGAGNLDTPCTSDCGAPRTYCLGHDWFENNTAPYPVYRVADDSLVQPEGA